MLRQAVGLGIGHLERYAHGEVENGCLLLQCSHEFLREGNTMVEGNGLNGPRVPTRDVRGVTSR